MPQNGAMPQQALGHTKSSATLWYIKSHLDPRLTAANRKLLQKLFPTQ